MAEILGSGYRAIADFIYENWTFVQLEDGEGKKIIRVSSEDVGMETYLLETPLRIEYRLYIKGSDLDINIPCTVQYISIYDSLDGGILLTRDELTPPLVLTEVNDSIEIDSVIEIPRRGLDIL